MNAYSKLAHFYESFTADDGDYDLWSQYLNCKLSFVGASKGVDLACGTGKMTRRLARLGYEVIGVDNTSEMLDEAMSEGGRCRYVLQDMRRIDLPNKVDFVTCVNDGVNYLSQSETEDFFSRVFECLRGGGLFVFDISTEYKLKKVIGENVFYFDDDEVTCLWTNKLNADSVEMSVTVFERLADGKYSRGDESHQQYFHDVSELSQILRKCGFAVEICDEYNLNKAITDTTQRATFCCVKEKI